MKRAAELLGDMGLVFSSFNNIYAWHAGMDRPALLQRGESIFQNHIISLAFIDDRLYRTGEDGTIREIGSDVIIGTKRDLPYYKLAQYRGALIAAGIRKIEIKSGSGKESVNVPDVSLPFTDSSIITFGPGYKLAISWTQPHYPLSFRPKTLDMAVADGKIYVSSENVVSIDPEGREVKQLTDFLGDTVKLATNGKDVVSINSHSDERGEIRTVPGNEIIAKWHPEASRAGPGFGYCQAATMAGDTLILVNYHYDPKPAAASIYAVPLKQRALKNSSGYVEPLLLLRGAVISNDAKSGGNPLATVPASTIDQLLERSAL
jgi:hypothetical protein